MSDRRPNVLFVLTDQMRADAMGCMGNEQVHTPNLDALAEEGLLLPRAYTPNPVCTPARGSILTGCYPHVHRAINNNFRLPTTGEAFTHPLRDAGYRTGYIGKWHLDGEAKPGFVPPGPRRQGFEHWEGFNRGHAHLDGHPRFTDDGELYWEEGYQPAVQTDLAIDFIEEHRDDPFFLFLSWGPPHLPYEAPDEYTQLYDRESLDLRPNVPDRMAAQARTDLVAYYAMVTSLDEQVGRLVETLEDHGIAEDTVICFTSDHGEMMGSQGEYYKGQPFEESVHVPLILRYPDRIDAGRTSDAVVNLIDLMPTLLSVCDAPIPDRVQGRNIADHVLGRNGAAVPTSTYIEGNLPDDDAWRALRTRRHMIAIDDEFDSQYLFDMEEDPYQRHDLSDLVHLKYPLCDRLVESMEEYDDRYFLARR